MRHSRWCGALALGLGLLLAGCGGAPPREEEPEPVATTSGREEPPPRRDQMTLTTEVGSISPRAVEGALNPRMNRFMRCFGEGMERVEFLAGELRFSFRIHEDGSVRWVHLTESTLGDRPSERCALDVARSTRFPRPTGGEAEFSWGFAFPGFEDVRPPTAWTAETMGERLRDIPELIATCGVEAHFSVTAYVQPGGAVLAAGGSTPDAETDAVLECLLEQVRAWEMPDPGSYAAKVTFSIR